MTLLYSRCCTPHSSRPGRWLMLLEVADYEIAPERVRGSPRAALQHVQAYAKVALCKDAKNLLWLLPVLPAPAACAGPEGLHSRVGFLRNP